MNEWISVNDQLPKKNGQYIIHAPSMDKKKPFMSFAWYQDGEWQMVPRPFIPSITHWMKLDPPK